MEVITLTDKKQQFNGTNYYLCGKYFQKNGKRLHRVVWEFHNGEIPKGYHIHHVDGDRTNNNIENLALIQRSEHEKLHGSDEDRKAKARENIQKAIVAAAEWHKTEEGLAWHSERGKRNWEMRKPIRYECSFCGKEFWTKNVYSKNQNHFCHPNCKASYRRRRLRNESQVC